MKPNLLLDIHPLLSDRARLAIMVAVAGSRDEIDFNALLDALELTRGNLSTHLRRLEEGGLIEVNKSFVDRKPRTTYRCTESGREALNRYLQAVNEALKQATK